MEGKISGINQRYPRRSVINQDVQEYPSTHLETLDEALLFGNGHHADVLVIKFLVSSFLGLGQATAEISFLLGTLAEKIVELTAFLDDALDGGRCVPSTDREEKTWYILLLILKEGCAMMNTPTIVLVW